MDEHINLADIAEMFPPFDVVYQLKSVLPALKDLDLPWAYDIGTEIQNLQDRLISGYNAPGDSLVTTTTPLFADYDVPIAYIYGDVTMAKLFWSIISKTLDSIESFVIRHETFRSWGMVSAGRTFRYGAYLTLGGLIEAASGLSKILRYFPDLRQRWTSLLTAKLRFKTYARCTDASFKAVTGHWKQYPETSKMAAFTLLSNANRFREKGVSLANPRVHTHFHGVVSLLPKVSMY